MSYCPCERLSAMPRRLRVEYEGAIYHLMNRGDRREAIFLDEQDRQLFLETLAEACQKTGWRVHAFCLMNNHFHLIVETPRANLVAGMRCFCPCEGLWAMPRKLRVEYEGAIYHLMNRGDRREAIFLDEQDRQLFLETLGEACQKTDWQVHACCLMNNHFHLVVETPRANLVAGMRWFLGTYTARFNRRHKLFGHLFSGRYKSLIVDGSGTGYLKSVCD